MAVTPKAPVVSKPASRTSEGRSGAVIPILPGSERYSAAFRGTGGEYFGVFLKNILLSLVTLGIYGAWAKVNSRKFMWHNTEFHGQRFLYTGTGAELFKGYLKVMGAYLGVIIALGIANSVSKTAGMVAQGVLTLSIAVIVPYAIYWSRRYLMSRTLWRGVRLGMEPNGAGDYAKVFIRGYILTVFTLGLYYPIWTNRLYAAIIDRTYVGSLKMRYDGKGGDLFWPFVKALVLFPLTLGLYSFWYSAHVRRYRAEHTWIGDAKGKLDLRGGDLLKLFCVNLLVPLTLGLAFPWIVVYSMSLHLSRLSFEGRIDFQAIAQRPIDGSATADGMADALDVGAAF